MFDWLINQPANSTTEESQVYDTPETPAPIFAYRALKGILFDSPDYDDEDEDKENIAPHNPIGDVKESTRKSLFKNSNINSSPLRSKSTLSPSNMRGKEERYPISPSPRKRRQHMSPTKSILRTPGIPTPRRQNVNVTFKDVRASVSPIAVTERLLAAKNEARVVMPAQEVTKRTTKATKEVTETAVKTGDTVETLPVPAHDMGMADAYLKSTEREIKKLIRYSQRMREYARLSQRENTMLKRERDVLRREVEELRKTKATTKGLSDEQAVTSVLGFRVAGSRSDADTACEKCSTESGTEAKQSDKVHNAKALESSNRTASSRRFRVGEPRSLLEEARLNQTETGDTLRKSRGQVAEVMHRTRAATKAATRAQLPPDRLAAARERLRIKGDERRRTLSVVVG